MTIFICNNIECGWDGDRDDCVHPKHEPNYLLCPECGETVEWFDPHTFMPKLLPGSDQGCHECGLLARHSIHRLALPQSKSAKA